MKPKWLEWLSRILQVSQPSISFESPWSKWTAPHRLIQETTRVDLWLSLKNWNPWTFWTLPKIFRFFFKKFLITCISLDRRGGQMLNKYSFGLYTISYSLLVKLNIYSTLFSPINSNIFIYKIMAKNLIYNV